MEKRHPLARRPMWQVLAIAGFSFGVFGLLLGIFPAYSPLALLIGVLIAVVGLLAAMWNLRAYSRSSRLATAIAWSLMVILLAARSLALVIDPWWLWAVPLAALYFIAWALPAIRPGTSALLWREQTAPRTQLGRGCLALAIAMAPIAGALGASVGIFGSRFGMDGVVTLAVGGLALMGALAISFSTSYQVGLGRVNDLGIAPATRGRR